MFRVHIAFYYMHGSAKGCKLNPSFTLNCSAHSFSYMYKYIYINGYTYIYILCLTTDLSRMNTFNLLGCSYRRGPHFHFIHSLTGRIRRLPAQQYDLPQALYCVVLDADETERIDHAVAHGNALNDVEGHQWVLLAGDECRVEVSQDGEAVIWSPAHDVCCQNSNQDHHRLAATTQPLFYLLCLETRDIFEPEFARNLDVTHRHDNHRPNKLHSKNKQEVGSVVGLLVHRPDLSTEDLVSGWGTTVRVHGLRGKVSRRNWYQNGNNPDSCYQQVSCLELHARPQRMDDSHVPGGTQTYCCCKEAGNT